MHAHTHAEGDMSADGCKGTEGTKRTEGTGPERDKDAHGARQRARLLRRRRQHAAALPCLGLGRSEPLPHTAGCVLLRTERANEHVGEGDGDGEGKEAQREQCMAASERGQEGQDSEGRLPPGLAARRRSAYTATARRITAVG